MDSYGIWNVYYHDLGKKRSNSNEIPLSHETTSEPAEYVSSRLVHFSHTKGPLGPIPPLPHSTEF